MGTEEQNYTCHHLDNNKRKNMMGSPNKPSKGEDNFLPSIWFQNVQKKDQKYIQTLKKIMVTHLNFVKVL